MNVNIFWNENERRILSLWRLILQIVLFIIIMLLLQYAVLLVTALVWLITDSITPEQLNVKEIKGEFRPFAIGILYLLVTMVMVGIQEELTSRGYQLTDMAEGLNWKRVGPRGAIIGAAALAAYLLWMRPWQLCWGTTDGEVAMSLPGDEIAQPRTSTPRGRSRSMTAC